MSLFVLNVFHSIGVQIKFKVQTAITNHSVSKQCGEDSFKGGLLRLTACYWVRHMVAYPLQQPSGCTTGELQHHAELYSVFGRANNWVVVRVKVLEYCTCFEKCSCFTNYIKLHLYCLMPTHCCIKL